MSWPARLSFNQFAAEPRLFDEVVPAAAEAGVAGLGLSARRLETIGFERAAALIRMAGIPVSIYQGISYWASGLDAEGRPRSIGDLAVNLDQAQQLDAAVFGVSSGGLQPGDRDLRCARARVARGLADLAPLAAARGIRVALEPIHPIFGPARGVLFTLRETLDILDDIGSDYLGINLETHHQWWDPELMHQVARAGERIFIVQINDWASDEKDRLNNRALMGEGCIDFNVFGEALHDYDGWLDVEANSDELRALSLPELFGRIAVSFEESIGRHLTSRKHQVEQRGATV